MSDFDLDAFLAAMPAVTLPPGIAVSPWRRLHPDSLVDRWIVADVTLTVGDREFLRTIDGIAVGTKADALHLMQRKIVPAIRDTVAELRADALIVV